jgi:hypothetical protein
MFVIRHSFRLPAESSDPSGSPVESDGDGVAFDNYRNLARAIGVFQHGVKMFGIFDHVIIVYLAAFFGKRFTSGPGIRSGILSEKQDFIRHFFLLVRLIWS